MFCSFVTSIMQCVYQTDGQTLIKIAYNGGLTTSQTVYYLVASLHRCVIVLYAEMPSVSLGYTRTSLNSSYFNGERWPTGVISHFFISIGGLFYADF